MSQKTGLWKNYIVWSYHITTSSGGDDASSEVGFFDHFDLFEGLEAFSDDVAVSDVEVARSTSVVLGSSINFTESTNSGVSAHVQVASQGGTSDVVP